MFTRNISLSAKVYVYFAYKPLTHSYPLRQSVDIHLHLNHIEILGSDELCKKLRPESESRTRSQAFVAAFLQHWLEL